MISATKASKSLQPIDELRDDCKRWRKLVQHLVESNELVRADTEQQYKEVHARIRFICRKVLDEPSLPERRRRAIIQLDELLRPWSSVKSFSVISSILAHDLVKNQKAIEARLKNENTVIADGQYRKLAVTGGLAGLGGILVFLFMQLAGSDSAAELSESVHGLLASFTAYLGRTSFTEQFAIAILFSWLFGTWLLSRLSSS